MTRTVSSRCWSRLSLRGCGPLGGGERARATAADADSGDAEARETLQGGGERARVGVVQGPVNRRVAGWRHAAIGRDWPCCNFFGRASLCDCSPCNSLLNRSQLFTLSLAIFHTTTCNGFTQSPADFHPITCQSSLYCLQILAESSDARASTPPHGNDRPASSSRPQVTADHVPLSSTGAPCRPGGPPASRYSTAPPPAAAR